MHRSLRYWCLSSRYYWDARRCLNWVERCERGRQQASAACCCSMLHSERCLRLSECSSLSEEWCLSIAIANCNKCLAVPSCSSHSSCKRRCTWSSQCSGLNCNERVKQCLPDWRTAPTDQFSFALFSPFVQPEPSDRSEGGKQADLGEVESLCVYVLLLLRLKSKWWSKSSLFSSSSLAHHDGKRQDSEKRSWSKWQKVFDPATILFLFWLFY